MVTAARRTRASGEEIQTVGERSRRAKFEGKKRGRKDRGPTHCTKSIVRRETRMGTRRRQALDAPEWHKEPKQGEDPRVGKAKEQCRPGGMRSEEDDVWRSGPRKSLGTTLSVQGLVR